MHHLVTIKPELLTISAEQVSALAPFWWILIGSAVTIIFSVLKVLSSRWSVFVVSLVTLIGTICSAYARLGNTPTTLFNKMLIVDPYFYFFTIIFAACGLLTVLGSFSYLDKESLQLPEFNLLVLFSVIGMMLLPASLDMIVLFISLEIMSLAVYCLVGFRRSDRRSNEASVKYFILGSVASAILLYGAALLYGATGSTNIKDILAILQNNPAVITPVFTAGIGLILCGFLFKVASVPFHMWMPDVYEGAPTPVTGFMTTALKAAAFATFLRVYVSLGYGKGLSEILQSNIHNLIWISAVLTMAVGNFIALTQGNLKRMLAYSSIAHTGYLLIGFLTGAIFEHGYSPVVFYLVSYAAMNLGAFLILTFISTKNDLGLNLHDLSGMYKNHPWLSMALAIFMFSMAGLPPTAGFIAKYNLLYSAIAAKEITLVVIAVLCSAVSAYYYLRVIVYMYMKEPVQGMQVCKVSFCSVIAITATIFITLQVGILPTPLLEAAKKVILLL